jgi:hypothetical protein
MFIDGSFRDVHAAFENGVRVSDGIPLTSPIPVGHAPGFFTYSQTDSGMYTLFRHGADGLGAGAAKVLPNARIQSVTNDTVLVFAGIDINITASTIIADTRSPAAAALPAIGMSGRGFAVASETHYIDVYVVYNEATRNAAIVYITNAVAK